MLTINPDDRHQTMDGFGTAILTYDLLPAYQDPAFYDRVVFDFGLSILRLSVGGFENEHNDNDDPDFFDASGVSTEGMDAPMEVARQFQARGVRTTLATPWSPPAWMKTNRSTTMGGRLRPDMRAEFAEFLRAYATLAKERYGVTVDAISLQNELLFAQEFESCVYNPLQLRETLRAAQRSFAATDLGTQLVIPEEMGWADRFILYLEPLMADPETRDFRGFFASHGWNDLENWRKMAALVAPFGRKLWMTETSGQSADWQGALALAENVHDTIVGGDVSAFIYWQIDGTEPSRWALFANGEYTEKAYAMKHFARFVRPGMQRLYAEGETGDILTSAFLDAETGDLAVILVNPSESDGAITPQLANGASPLNWLTFTSVEGDYLRPSELLSGDSVTVPAKGIVTLYGRRNTAVEAIPTLRPTAWEAPALRPPFASEGGPQTDGRLQNAARANDIGRVRELLAEGVDPNGLNTGGLGALHRAAWPGHTEVVPVLIEGGADPNQPSNSGATPLLIAVANARDAFIELLAGLGGDVNQGDNHGLTPLDKAAQGGHVETVRLLLRLGANPRQSDEHGWTPLHWAASSSRSTAIEVMQILLENGADPAARDVEGMTPLHIIAANFVNPRAPNSRWRARGDQHGLYINAERLRVLIEAGAPVNARDIDGRTALHWAAWVGETLQGEDVARRPYFEYRVEGIRYLLAAGADPNATDKDGRTPADYARAEGYAEAADLLTHLDHRPWLTGGIPSVDNTTSGASGGDPAPGPSLSLNRQLAAAAARGDRSRVDELIAEGAEVGALVDGSSALHAAVIAGHREIAMILLAAGADPHLRDSDGYSALDRARQNNEETLVGILQKGTHP